MLYKLTDVTVGVETETVLSHFDFEIHGTEKIAVVGKNGAGKTTLLRTIAGELDTERDDKREGIGTSYSRNCVITMLKQQPFVDKSITVEAELLKACPYSGTYAKERFEYELEYDKLFTGFGFSKIDKKKQISAFSGGEQTKIALIKILLEQPDILLLDEPTNHLDINTTEWLEAYLRKYKKAVVIVSHDRFFLDKTVDVVYEIVNKKLIRYVGNYTQYREQKVKNVILKVREYQRQQENINRLELLIEKFKHKPNKAAFARSKRSAINRIVMVEKPEADDVHVFTKDIEPNIRGSKRVFEAEHLKIGYKKQLLEISIKIQRGQKIGLLGDNGVGKTTFLKTIAGLIPQLDGKCSLGADITIGYFDQLSASIISEKTVIEHFSKLFPILTEKEARGILGSYLFVGRDATKKVSTLSGGEKARLVMAELLESRPNFLILDEPTNHMDIQAKETLESALKAYKGTIIFVSHDRYFIRQVADSVIIFENKVPMYYPFGYDHYMERISKQNGDIDISAQITAEEQALIAGIRAVPKAERHRLSEIPTRRAYEDWCLRIVFEQMTAEEKKVEKLWNSLEQIEIRELEENFLGLDAIQMIESYAIYQLKKDAIWTQYNQQVSIWTNCCVEWYDLIYDKLDRL